MAVRRAQVRFIATTAAVVGVMAATPAVGASTATAAPVGVVADPSAWQTESVTPVGGDDTSVRTVFAGDGARVLTQLRSDGRASVSVALPGALSPTTLDLGATAPYQFGFGDASGQPLSLAVDHAGTAVVTWVDAAGVPRLRTRTPGSATWGAPVTLPATDARSPRAALGPDGSVLVVWRARTSTGDVLQTAVIPPGAVPGPIATIASAGTGYFWWLQAGFDDGVPQAVWSRGSSSNDSDGDTQVQVASAATAAADPTWHVQTVSTSETSSSPQLLVDIGGNATLVYQRIPKYTQHEQSAAVLPFEHGRPQLDADHTTVFPTPDVGSTVVDVDAAGADLVWYQNDVGAVGARWNRAGASSGPTPMSLPSSGLVPARLFHADDGTDILVVTTTQASAMAVTTRRPGQAVWSSLVGAPVTDYGWFITDATASRSGTLTVTVADLRAGHGNVIAITTDTVGQGGLFQAVTPVRVLDTRIGLGAPAGRLAPGGQLTLRPLSARYVGAVQLNVTATNANGAGYLQLFPHFAPRPTTSNVNFDAGRTVANQVTVQLAYDGTVTLYNGSATSAVDVVADLTGWFRSGTSARPGETVTVTPQRIVDTRSGRGVPRAQVAAGADLTFPVTGGSGVPSTGVGAVLLNVTATSTAEPGHLAAHPAGSAVPPTSDLNTAPGRDSAAAVLVPVGVAGAVAVHNGSPTRAVDVVVDVIGYVSSGVAALPGAFVPVDAARLVDTRTPGGACATGAIADRCTVAVSGRAGIPPTSVAAAVFTLTATDTSAPGYLGIGPRATATSTVNFGAADTVANATSSQLDPAGQIVVLVGPHGARSDVVLDVRGYVIG